ncbi:MAG: lipopolysaccharide biosynthesis protein [Bacteroides sp.]|nr:lipopolysaccharide biosynthesis protein [Bacteroides sp.]
MEKNVQNKVIKGIIWTSIDKFGSMAIQFIVIMILSRLLDPTDFGIIGMLSLFMAVGALLIDSGFSHALIQKASVSEEDYSTVFFINLLIGISLYALLFGSAPFIARFFNTPQLTPFVKTIFLMFPINSLCVVHLAKLTRELQFKTIAKISVISALISGVTGISMAYSGYGVWALIYQQLSLYLSRVVMYWYTSKWYPKSFFNKTSFYSLIRFSTSLLGSGLIITIFDNIYVFIVGKLFPLKTTGFFNQAWQYGTMLPALLTGVVSKATFPIFCQMHENPIELKDSLRKTLNMSLFISIPCLFGTMIMAPSIFVFFLSDKWFTQCASFSNYMYLWRILTTKSHQYRCHKSYWSRTTVLIFRKYTTNICTHFYCSIYKRRSRNAVMGTYGSPIYCSHIRYVSLWEKYRI